ncbi:MAG: TRAP transporter large permease [Deinococcota bacterium]|nr:TRAP transporter large permease [Deinococcota bacterium]
MLLLLGIFAVLLAIGVPIAFALGLAGVAYLVNETPLPMLAVFQRMFTSLDSFPFLAIPFFILAGALMNGSGLSEQIINFSRTLVGHLRGGLANVSIVASMFFGGVSGSAIADSSALGSILIPAMKREGYHARFAAAINATSSTMGIIIPPSIPMILAGVATQLSIRELFFGGIVPGVMVALGMILMTTYLAKKRGYQKYERASVRDVLVAGVRALPALGLVLIILGGIMAGVFTATEASVAAVLYALLLGLIYRRWSMPLLYRACVETVVSSAVVMIVISTAGFITWLLAYSLIPQALATSIGGTIDNPVVLLSLLALMFLLAGTILDVSPGVLLFGPILLPVVRAVGIDPIHFGVVMVFGLAIGLFTPPVGTTMMISAHIAKTPVLGVARESVPYLFVMVVILFLLVFFSGLVLWLPTTLFR